MSGIRSGNSYTRFYSVSLLFLVFILSGCGNDPQPLHTTHNITMMDDTVVNYNKSILNAQEQDIENFIKRYGWKMTRTGTGLRYMIYKQGTGEKALEGKKAVFRYEVRLINGNLCYSSGKSGPREFLIGHGGVEPGLEEAILLLKVGDRAKLIVPSHLAFGLLGDQDKIPPQSTLVYDIELIKVK